VIDLDKLTPKQIAALPHSKVFEVVRAGKWTRVDFDRWLEEALVQACGEGFAEALETNPPKDEGPKNETLQ
jgi:hypothetical protein